MHRLVSDLFHLLLQQSRHGSHHVSVFRICVRVEQLERILLAVEQLPRPILATLSCALNNETLIVPVYEFVPLVSAAVMGICLVDDVAVHPVAVVGYLNRPSRVVFARGEQRAEREALHVRGYAHSDLEFPGWQHQLLDAVLDTGVPTVLVLSGGQAFALSNSTLRSNAILHSFLAGEYTADSIVEILYGKANSCGKLPISLPQASGATTAYYDYLPSDTVLAEPGTVGVSAWQWPVLQRQSQYTFGYGLSYTTFFVSPPTLSTTNDTVEVSTSLTNTAGSVAKRCCRSTFGSDTQER
jgi:hypothetical protein